MNTTRLIIYLNLFLLYIPPIDAYDLNDILVKNSLRFEHFSVNDGLSYPNVYGIFQDHRDFLWFATKYGLNRYNGMDCKVFIHDSNNPNSLSNNFTWIPFEDSQKKLWIVTYGGGLEIFDPTTESFKHYQHQQDNPNSLNNDYVWCIFEDRNGQFWFGTDGGLDHFDPENELFTHYTHNHEDPNSLSHDVVTMVTEDKQGILWIGTYGGGLNRFDPRTQIFTHYKHKADNPDSLSNDSVNFVYIDKQDILWIGTLRGLNNCDLSYSINQNDYIIFNNYYHKSSDLKSLSNNRVRSIYEDKNGNLWFATSGGLNLYNKKNDNFIYFQSEINKPHSLSHNSLYYVTGDKTGTLWIGTANGVDKLDPGNQQFEIYLSGFHIHSIYEAADGTLEIGTNKGLKNIKVAQNNKYSSEYKIPEYIRSKIVIKILPYSDRYLWIATQGQGLYKCDYIKGTCINYKHNPNDINSLNYDTILDIEMTSKGIIWIALSGFGLDRFDPKLEKFTHYKHKSNNSNSIISNWTRAILIDSYDNIWIGTEGGLSCFDPVDKIFTNYFTKRNSSNSLSNSIVNMIFEDSNKGIWIATNGGLNKFDPISNNFQIFQMKNGLPGNSISGILEDNSGYLWVSTNNGLSKFDHINNIFRNYDQLDGLQGRQFIYHSAFKNKNGKLYFGGTNGLNGFLPDKLKDNTNIPPVYITDFCLFNEPVTIGGNSPLKKHISFTKQITLNHSQSVFSFKFVALNYRASKKNQYAYIMEGFDKNWTYTDSIHRQAKYTNLNPGKYVFKVKASNNDGIWNEKGVSLKIIILPAWWMTWWFKGLLIVSFIASGFGIFYWRMRTINYRNLMLKNLVEERTYELKLSQSKLIEAKKRAENSDKAKSQFLANMSHELRTPLNSILGYTQIIRKNNNLTKEQIEGINIIHKSGEHLLTLINDILDLAKVEAGKITLNPKPAALQELLDSVVSIIRMAAYQKNIQLVYEQSKNLPFVINVDAKRLRQVLFNLLGNAVKFTDKGYVHFKAETKYYNDSKAIIQFVIKDTGIGIKNDQISNLFKPFEQSGDIERKIQGTGLGLAVSHQLVNHMGGDIQVKTEFGKGSTFIFEISADVLNKSIHIDQIQKKRKVIDEFYKKRLKILIVDDIEENRKLLYNLLNPLGFEIIMAINGKDGVEQAISAEPDLILMDMVMPVMNGFKAVEEIRKIPRFEKTIIIGVSANVIESEKKKSYDAGCNDFLAKPVMEDKLFKIIEKYLPVKWIYKQSEKLDIIDHNLDSNSDFEGIIPPPIDELNILYDLARFGSMDLIQQQARHIETLDNKYIPFAKKLYALSDEFEDELIVSIVKQFIDSTKRIQVLKS